MSTEPDRVLTRLYATLGAEAQYAPLPSPEVLRRRGDRRTVSRATLAVAAAAVLATGAAVGGNELLGGDTRVVPAPPVSPTPSPTVPVSPSASPSPSATRSATPSRSSVPASPTVTADPAPTSVPDRVFLTAAEVNERDLTDSENRVQFPDLCGRGPVADPSPVLVRARSGYVRRPDVVMDTVPDATLYHSVARYASTARARAWMLDLEEAVRSCPVRTWGKQGGRSLYRLLPDAPAIADEVVFIEERVRVYDVGRDAFTDNYSTVYTVAIRHGDAITVIFTGVYEDFGFTGPERMKQLAVIAGERLVAWRGVVAGSS